MCDKSHLRHEHEDERATQAVIKRVSKALYDEPIERAVTVLANMLVMSMRMRTDYSPDETKEILTRIISDVVEHNVGEPDAIH
jgi:hypothetical protein